MTSEKLKKFHQNTQREVEYYAEIANINPSEFITKVQEVMVGRDEYGNPSDDTFLFIAKEFQLPHSVAKHFFYLS